MDSHDLGDKVVSDVKKDFVAMGSHRVHGWYAWAIVGLVAGMAGMIMYVANFQGKFEQGSAMIICPNLFSPYPFNGDGFSSAAASDDDMAMFEKNKDYYGTLANVPRFMNTAATAVAACETSLKNLEAAAAKVCTDQQSKCEKVATCKFSHSAAAVTCPAATCEYDPASKYIGCRSVSPDETVTCNCKNGSGSTPPIEPPIEPTPPVQPPRGDGPTTAK